MSEQKSNLIFIPFPVFSHFLSAIKMAELLVDADDHLSITVLITKLQFPDTKITSYIKNSPDSRITFIEVQSPETDSQKGSVKAAIEALTGGKNPSKLAGIFVDILRVSMIDVAAELGIPAFVFFTCGAAILGLMFHLQGLMSDRYRGLAAYQDSDSEISVSTYVNPVPAKVWPSTAFNNDGFFFDMTKKLREASGIIVNTFLELEPHAISALAGDRGVPEIYPVGPLLQEVTNDGAKNRADILEWLDEQPDSSVVFLCFGSHGCFNKDQVKEIATALERSGRRFLWSLRMPPSGEKTECENLGEVLPEGFLDRTAEIGKVIGWAPQMAVLSHRAVGGFVSHCGWNSILESVWCGVPIAAWPMYAEQQSNAFQLVKEMGIAVEIKMDYRKNAAVLVSADKIEKGINQLMDLESEIRVNVKELREKSRSALTEGGSSRNYVNRLIEDIKRNLRH